MTLYHALELAVTRLELLTARMHECHEDTGRHTRLAEAEAFCKEGREALKAFSEPALSPQLSELPLGGER